MLSWYFVLEMSIILLQLTVFHMLSTTILLFYFFETTISSVSSFGLLSEMMVCAHSRNDLYSCWISKSLFLRNVLIVKKAYKVQLMIFSSPIPLRAFELCQNTLWCRRAHGGKNDNLKFWYELLAQVFKYTSTNLIIFIVQLACFAYVQIEALVNNI